jgi:spore maturation protein SpmA
MLNRIWLGLLLAGVLIAGATDRLEAAATAAFSNAKTAVDLSLGLIGVMTLWLGLMRLAERSGLVRVIARFLHPVLVRLFPDVPAGHPALGSMVLNLAANALGLTNAATPLGLRAMRDLESLNPRPGIATNAMCTFLALNTGSVQLIPVTAIALLAAAGSKSPTAIIGSTLIATAISSAAALVVVKVFERLPWYRLRPSVPPPSSATPEAAPRLAPASPDASDQVESALAPLRPLNPSSWIALTALFGFFVWLTIRVVFLAPAAQASTDPVWLRIIQGSSVVAVPFLLVFFPLYAALRGLAVYEEFIEGAKEGFQTAVRIIPFLVGILVAIGFLRGSGGIDLLSEWTGPLLRRVGFPPELLPMALLRPLTSSGTLATLGDLVKVHGADSLLARTGATLFGSTETTFYVIAVYFGAVGVRKTRHAVWAGLAADLAGAIAAVVVCRALWG